MIEAKRFGRVFGLEAQARQSAAPLRNVALRAPCFHSGATLTGQEERAATPPAK
ncbi:hypothetical protein K9U39_12990 [Rhodoblastus acidophilus]|uniref:Uncharacterized protein n=1 Tax=Candidatus Rhodoblastus alkanivorans TaxID=2954117 RepID=A0ABS9ZC11_9HYPH|nr:hypothetical protein [Candidatus Rhodoblastus alkanivorans]MCI4677173.1 hypothetical protein [Candidatus Rhodoblastus alkanivorans]MCI4684526.1 hypothetical protein [Candidatus Rhodoblastus alkanivorans]MDI4641847.1 hypothetical protein [Rhodoblastus acidophilus]